MLPKDIFGIIVRTIGLVLLLYVVFALLNILFSPPPPMININRGELLIRFIAGNIPYLLIGIIFTRKADWIVDFCYPNRSQNSASHISVRRESSDGERQPLAARKGKSKTDKWYEPFETDDESSSTDPNAESSGKQSGF